MDDSEGIVHDSRSVEGVNPKPTDWKAKIYYTSLQRLASPIK